MEYLNWGCEFIGGESPPPPEKYFESAIWLPVDILLTTSKQSLSEQRIDGKIISISEKGLEEPGLLHIGHNACYLKDGNHRLHSVNRMGWGYFPVEIKIIDKVIKNGAPINRVVEELLKREKDVKFKKF